MSKTVSLWLLCHFHNIPCAARHKRKMDEHEHNEQPVGDRKRERGHGHLRFASGYAELAPSIHTSFDLLCLWDNMSVSIGDTTLVLDNWDLGTLVERKLYTRGMRKLLVRESVDPKNCQDNRTGESGQDENQDTTASATFAEIRIECSTRQGYLVIGLWQSGAVKICVPNELIRKTQTEDEIAEIMHMVTVGVLSGVFNLDVDVGDVVNVGVNTVSGHINLRSSMTPASPWSDVFSTIPNISNACDTSVVQKPPYNIVKVWLKNDSLGVPIDDRQIQFNINTKTGYTTLFNARSKTVLKKACSMLRRTIKQLERKKLITIGKVIKRNRSKGVYAELGLLKRPGRPTIAEREARESRLRDIRHGKLDADALLKIESRDLVCARKYAKDDDINCGDKCTTPVQGGGGGAWGGADTTKVEGDDEKQNLIALCNAIDFDTSELNLQI